MGRDLVGRASRCVMGVEEPETSPCLGNECCGEEGTA